MTSEKKKHTSRANAMKSTGPKTEAGKSLARFNALKLGNHAAPHLLPGEDTNAFRILEQELFATCNPVGPIENLVTRRIVNCAWYHERLENALHAALRRVEIETIANESGNANEIHYVSENDIDQALKQELTREELQRFNATSESSTPDGSGEVEQHLAAVSPLNSSPPVRLTFLKVYGGGKNSQHVAEINRQLSAATKELLRLYTELEAIQARRKTLTAPINEVSQLRPLD